MSLVRCNINSLHHIDYKKPLFPGKESDYRTSSGHYHEFRPENPQNFDCRHKAKINSKLLARDVRLRDEGYKSTYTDEFLFKLDTSPEKYFTAAHLAGVNYLQNVEEKLRRNPPCSFSAKVSEMKDSYKRAQLPFSPSFPQRSDTKCELVSYGRDEQPRILPETPCYWKHLDIYLTENKGRHVPFTYDQMKQSSEDLITYYNLYGLYKGLSNVTLPRPTGNRAIYDKMLFKYECLPRTYSRAPKNIPNAMQSEMRRTYTDPSSSEFYPHLKSLKDVHFDESLPNSGPWQDLCPPAMYCTESCHIGTGWPVKAIIN